MQEEAPAEVAVPPAAAGAVPTAAAAGAAAAAAAAGPAVEAAAEAGADVAAGAAPGGDGAGGSEGVVHVNVTYHIHAHGVVEMDWEVDATSALPANLAPGLSK